MHYCTTYPLSNVLLRAEKRPRKISDYLTLEALHRLEYYDYVLRPAGIEHQMRLWLPAPPLGSRVFFFNRQRQERDFSERDRSLLELLRPFFAEVSHERFRLARTTTPAEEYGLACREVEVLRWVACGKRRGSRRTCSSLFAKTSSGRAGARIRKLGIRTPARRRSARPVRQRG